MKKNYRIKKTISMKQFISEFGESFSPYMKKRLLELEVRCVLTRSEDNYVVNLKHVEHTKYEFGSNSESCMKEYIYGQFVVIDEYLYFSNKCTIGPETVESPVVSSIYSSLDDLNMVNTEEGITAKIVDDSNIDYVINSILAVCPQVTQSYLDIISRYSIIDDYSLKKARY